MPAAGRQKSRRMRSSSVRRSLRLRLSVDQGIAGCDAVGTGNPWRFPRPTSANKGHGWLCPRIYRNPWRFPRPTSANKGHGWLCPRILSRQKSRRMRSSSVRRSLRLRHPLEQGIAGEIPRRARCTERFRSVRQSSDGTTSARFAALTVPPWVPARRSSAWRSLPIQHRGQQTSLPGKSRQRLSPWRWAGRPVTVRRLP